MINYLGEIAAIATSFCWSFGSIFFTLSSRLIGSGVVNRIRLTLAFFLIMLMNYILYGNLLPFNASPATWFWFGLSGIIGFSIGDSLLFRSFVLVGPRLSMLMMSLAPIFGVVIAWIFLGETLAWIKIMAIIITLSGITMVITVRGENSGEKKLYLMGLLCGLGAALGQALGLILSKRGLAENLPPLSGNLIRILFATICLWLYSLIDHSFLPAIRSVAHNRRALKFLSAGVIFGPFLGVWLSLVAVKYTYIGIASTLMALPPVILIPLSALVFKEKIPFSAILGTIIALIGVALIFLL